MAPLAPRPERSPATTPARIVALPEPRTDRRFGELLEEVGVPGETIARALADPGVIHARLGEMLRADGRIDDDTLVAALSRQSGIGAVDLIASPPDQSLADTCEPETCLHLGFVPWRSFGRVTVLAIADPDRVPEIQTSFSCRTEILAFVLAPRGVIERSVATMFRDRMRDTARDYCPDALSCRGWTDRLRAPRMIDVALAAAALVLLSPSALLLALFVWIVLANTATTLLRLSALLHHRRTRRAAQRQMPEGVVRLAPRGGARPVISLLIPLLHEDRILSGLIGGLSRMDYPKACLDVKLLLEEDDAVTWKALQAIDLPAWITPLVVPDDTLRTKPRAMNYALPFCRGEIVGIYDAEDRPEPDQLQKVADALTTAPPDVACVQGYLDFYNPRQNWLARCFTIEYAMWFRVLLQGVERLGVPIPLGGTTVFFRRRILEDIGGWDAHNVTEDADLGMRLARFGYRCEMVATTTMEEANCHAGAWVKQRSRWLKGYAMTWLTHMRRPAELLRDLGWRGFLGFQVLFLGAITAYLAAPLLWVLWLGVFGVDIGVWEALPAPVWWLFLGSMIVGQLTQIAVAATAVWATPRRHLLPVIPTLLLYWPLGALAAYKAVLELFTRPFYWHKTRHGLDQPLTAG